MGGGWGLAHSRQRILIDGVPYIREASMPGTGEERDSGCLLADKIRKARHAESLSDPKHHGELRHLKPSHLDLLYPAGGLA